MASRVNLDGTFSTEGSVIDNIKPCEKTFEEILEIYKERKKKRDEKKDKRSS
ncbi:MAG: hypothetical protein H8D23_38545 [Candidatus Brocadiales bacterium]|nr:hypothetical protein [Candidatus Brocadiales bacterium]